MNCYQKRRRTPALQIISMIDILIILLIFLVVSTTFKQAQSALNVSLPSSSEMALGTPAETGRLTLSLTKDEKIYLSGISGTSLPGADPQSPPTDLLVSPSDLLRVLTDLKTTQPHAKLELKVDEKASFGLLIQLWDALTKAGFKVNEVPARVLRATKATS